jgi:obg-like ATPase 1
VLFSAFLPRFSHSPFNFCFVSHSSDFENKFVCGEIMSYDDLKEHGSEAAVKAAGKLRQQGKPYESTSCFCSPSESGLSVDIFCSVVDGDIAYWKAGN